MSGIRLEIDGREVEVPAGRTVLDAAAALGIEIPTLCWHPDLTPVGSCRLCVVEVEGSETAPAACVTEVRPGMVVRTESDALADERRDLLEMLLADYDDAGRGDAPHAETEFERWCRRYGAQRPAPAERAAPRFEVDGDPNPFVRVDLNQCILCTRCVRACEEIQGRFVWSVGGRGRDAKIIAGEDTTMLDARCESCGACVAACPTDALDDKMAFGAGVPDEKVTTTCAYCGVGCQLDLNVKDDRIVRVTERPTPHLPPPAGEPAAPPPLNGISLCVKGRYGYDFVHHPDRLTTPLVREELLEGAPRTPGAERGRWIEVGWDRALDLVADRLAAIHRESGGDALGLFSSAKCSNEENYLMQKLARQVLGTHNVDHCARLCHSSTVAGLAMSYGSGAMSNSMDDVVEQARALFVIGSNNTEQHPVFGARIRQAVLRRGVKTIVADPRRIDITEFATLHLRQAPGTDVALVNGLMHLVLEDGREDRAFIEERCEEFEAFAETVRRYDPETVAEITGVPPDLLRRAAAILGEEKPAAVIWAMGITQHTTGVMNVLSLANLQMLLGNMGVPGGGVNPLRGQNNVQGACDMGALPNVFPGYQPVADPDVAARFEAAWALGGGGPGLSAKAGLTVTEMIDEAASGRIRGLYLLGENPALTDPDSNHVRRCLARAELVVLQEIFPSETSRYADVLLPGVTFAERDGTFTNTERRVQRFRRAVPPPGDARPDWEVIADLARRVLARQGRTPRGPHAGWDVASPAAVLREVGALTPSYRGVTHERLDRGERLQWPVPDERHPGTPILHVGRFTRGKGRFHAVDHLPAKELPDDDYPMLLTTGRVLYHWHGGEMTRRARGLAAICDRPYVEVAADDAARLGLGDGDPVRLVSRRGEMLAVVAVTTRVSPGVVFGNFHFAAEQNVNNLTIGALDPVAKIPEYKVCAVRLETVDDR